MDFSDFIFRPLNRKDASGLYKLVSRNIERLEKYFPVTLKSTHSILATKNYVRQNIRKAKLGEGYYYLVDSISEGRPVAFLILKNIDWRIPKAELAYFVDGAFEGKGFGTWAVGKLVHEASQVHEFHKLFLLADEHNYGSCRVAEKNGFLLEGVMKDDYRTGVGDLINSKYFGLVVK